LFSVVQFPNDVCTSTSGTYTNGTCITTSECADRGGAVSGTCAAGFGVCCIYTYSTTGDIISQNVSYIVNPSYPSNYVPSSPPTTVSFTIQKTSCDVCRLRLDFEVFILTIPTSSAQVTWGGATIGPTWGICNTDYMTIKTTAHQTVSSTTGNYGNYPYLCGTNSGHHAYIDMSCTCTDTATLDFVLGDTTNNQWKIKATQLSCDDRDVASTEGCFQYFTSESGTFQSFGFDSLSMICGHNYATCIRPLDGYCCVEYTPTKFEVPSWIPDTPGATTCTWDGADAADNCIGAGVCQRNYVIIPGALSQITGKADASEFYIPPNGLERYCGTIFTAEGNVAVTTAPHSPVITCQRPFRFFGVTADCGTPGVTGTATTNVEGVGSGGAVGGWQFTFRQLSGGC